MYYLIAIILLVGIDQLSKYLIVQNFFEGETLPVITNFFHLTYVKNKGVAFGMFQGKVPIISIVVFIVICGLIYLLFFSKKKFHKYDKIVYVGVLAGAIGNLIDRIFRGFVVDMMDFRGIWSYVFNVADMYIVVAAIFGIIVEVLLKKKEKGEVESR